jgi:hypothetical protein
MLQVQVTWPEFAQTVIVLGGNFNTIKWLAQQVADEAHA